MDAILVYLFGGVSASVLIFFAVWFAGAGLWRLIRGPAKKDEQGPKKP